MQSKSATLPTNVSRVFRLSEMTPTKSANGGEGYSMTQGTLPTGEAVSVHESRQPAGAKPNPPHTIEHTEFLCLLQGALEFTHNGKTERVEAGDIAFIAKGTLHGVRNVGDVPAQYVVVAVGGDVHG